MTQRPPQAEIDATVGELAARFGNRLVTSMAVREQHGHNLSWTPNQPPDAVIFAQSTEDVSDAVKICAAHGVPVIALGTNTSLEGHTNAPYGGVCIDVSQMNNILEVHAEDLDVVLQPGVTRKALNDYLRDTGLFFPIDPGADASIGGMCATRASGTNAVRYGTMKDNVLALTVVMPDGRIVKTARRAKKSSAGYDLTRLFVGSEGTLGIITEITLKLYGIPEAISAATCQFPSIKAACDTVIETIQSGLPIARIELVDPLTVRAFNNYAKLGLNEAPMLFLEFHGTEKGVEEQTARFKELAEANGGGPFNWTTKPEERTKLWQARHDVYWAHQTLKRKPEMSGFSTDVCVPISRLADCVTQTIEDAERIGIVAPVVGHVGDGNFHTGPQFDPGDPDDVAKAKTFVERLVRRALDMGGTCTGEHGVGQAKIKYMREEHSPETLNVMRAIKRALDPQNIMNPGKVLDA
ncbi:MAG TPA: FAD-linked oxidase C-terminal domain-containing protein [Rhodoblastus sp.]|nr:FAD-linked oxidase C-terminal domain-containing protein [Rhodoblastus sp.]